MFVKAKSSVAHEVIEWLKRSYSCNISDLFIPSPTFHGLVRSWVETLFELLPSEEELVQASSRIVEHSLEIEYITQLKELSKLTVKLKSAEVIKMCKKLKNRQEFVFALNDHLFNITKINIGSLTIGQLKTTSMGLDRSGRFKMSGHISRTEASSIVNELIELSKSSQPKATNIIRPTKRGPSSVHSNSSERKIKVAPTNILEKPGFNIYTPKSNVTHRTGKAFTLPVTTSENNRPRLMPRLSGKSVSGSLSAEVYQRPVESYHKSNSTPTGNYSKHLTHSPMEARQGFNIIHPENRPEEKIYSIKTPKEESEEDTEEESEEEEEEEEESEEEESEEDDDPVMNEARTNRKEEE
ncbi:hypothetical protein G6F56_009717 [Rhizopus delemar]|nr:hypothetical protein G6F56_009717 [Rhizopus delemar]